MALPPRRRWSHMTPQQRRAQLKKLAMSIRQLEVEIARRVKQIHVREPHREG